MEISYKKSPNESLIGSYEYWNKLWGLKAVATFLFLSESPYSKH